MLPTMNTLEQIDNRIADIAEQSEHILGFVREGEAPLWTLLFAQDVWVDIRMDDNGLMSIATEIGSPPDLLASQKMNELMLNYTGFSPDTAFSMGADGTRSLRQFLPRTALEQPGFKTMLEGFAAKAQAWRELLQTPANEANTASGADELPLRASALRG